MPHNAAMRPPHPSPPSRARAAAPTPCQDATRRLAAMASFADGVPVTVPTFNAPIPAKPCPRGCTNPLAGRNAATLQRIATAFLAEFPAILCNRSRPPMQPRCSLFQPATGGPGESIRHCFPPAALRRFRRAKAAPPCWNSISSEQKNCIPAAFRCLNGSKTPRESGFSPQQGTIRIVRTAHLHHKKVSCCCQQLTLIPLTSTSPSARMTM